ncbi:hypothetical protein FSP39_016838 [Pinctada imbricata]|uniref:Major facilitator superfamily domain-containing protein 12 n=1 Tax=Pinctada imbricata TaxID=66713 RepID=A0AA88Y4X9_PINIB|nr:hypothetical protein FSP39_016838 [Pinctada imbricata]
MADSERRMPFSQRLAYSVGHVLNDLTASMWFSYLIVYFHQVKQFQNILAGYLMLIGQISDALFTPFIGIESDRTSGIFRMGKRKSWHFIGTVCVAIAFPFIFNECIGCEDSTRNLNQFIYYAPFVVIFQFGWASTQISHLSLIPDLTPDEHERVELNSLRYAFTVISNLIVFGVFWLLFDYKKSVHTDTSMLSGDDSPKFRNLVFIVVGLGLLVSIMFHIIVKEPSRNSRDSVDRDEVSISIEKSALQKNTMTWKDWLKNTQFYQIGLMYMCTRLFVNVSQIYLPLWVTETLKLPKDSVAIFPLIVYVSGFITSIVMRPLNKVLGRKIVFMIGLVIGLGSCVWVYFLDEGSRHLSYYPTVLLGIGGSTILVTSLAMTADLINKNVESAAFVYGAMSFTDKLSNGVAVVLIQHLHPCESCCPECDGYYKKVLTFVPGGVAALAFIVLLTLLPYKIGQRDQKGENAGFSCIIYLHLYLACEANCIYELAIIVCTFCIPFYVSNMV